MLKSSTFLVYVWICWVSCFTCCTKRKKYAWKSDFTHLFICIPPAVLAPLVIKWYSMQVPLNLGFLLQHKPLAGINLSSSQQLTVKIENRSERMIFVFTLFMPSSLSWQYFVFIYSQIYISKADDNILVQRIRGFVRACDCEDGLCQCCVLMAC